MHKVSSSYVIDTTRNPQTCSSTICPAQEQALRSMSCSKPDGGEAGNCNGAQLCHIAVAWKSNSYQKEKGTLSKKFLNICQPKSLHHDNLTTGTVLSSIRRVSYGWIVLSTKDLYHVWSFNLPPFQSSPAWTSLPRSGFIIGIGLQLWHHMPPTSMPLRRGSSKKNVVCVCPSIYMIKDYHLFIKYRFKFQWDAFDFDRLTLVKEFSSWQLLTKGRIAGLRLEMLRLRCSGQVVTRHQCCAMDVRCRIVLQTEWLQDQNCPESSSAQSLGRLPH